MGGRAAAHFQCRLASALRAAAAGASAAGRATLLAALATLLTLLAALVTLLAALLTLLAALIALLAGLIALFAALLALLAGLLALALLATLILLRHACLLVWREDNGWLDRAVPPHAQAASICFHIIRQVSHPRSTFVRYRRMRDAKRSARVSDLYDLLSPWERKFPHPMHDAVLRGLFGVDVNVLRPAFREQPFGNAGPLAQDVF